MTTASVFDRFKLDGRVALVTGGARGLGRVIAEALASAGAGVALTSRRLDQAEAAAGAIASSSGVRTLPLEVDVTSVDQVEAMVARTVERLGRLDILVNNAGINIRGPIEQLRVEDYDLVLDTNLKGAWLACRAAGQILRRQRWGRVVNVSSMLGAVSIAGRTAYAASKGGLTMLTRTLALEWAPDGVTVNALCPGPFATEINAPLLADPVKRARMEADIPLGRWGDPVELGPAALFLASDASSFVTGSTLFIDGGYTAR